MPLVTEGLAGAVVGRGVVVLVVRQPLAGAQIALVQTTAIVNRAAAGLHRPGLVETDVLDHEVADHFGRRDRLAARQSRVHQKDQDNGACSEHHRGTRTQGNAEAAPHIQCLTA